MNFKKMQNLSIDFKKEPFITISKMAKKRNEEFFLVGGFIRDRLIESQESRVKSQESGVKDIDFAISGDPIGFAREVSSVLKGTFVLLDENCGRVVLKGGDRGQKTEDRQELTLDFSRIEGDIEKDIRRRDFTINSLAMRGPDFLEIIDLTGGAYDISKKTIKMVSLDGLIKDPLRLLRAIRLSSSLNFKIEKETISAIKENAHLVTKSAPERITYELFEILKNRESYKFLKLSYELGILSHIIPEIIPLSNIEGKGYHHLNLLEHSFETVRQIEKLADNFLFPDISCKARNIDISCKTRNIDISCKTRNIDISYKARNIKEYLNETMSSNHTRISLLKLIGFLHDLGKPETIKEEDGRLRFIGHERLGEKYVQNIGHRLKFSHQEILSMKRVVLNHMRVGTLIQGGIITKKAVFRLFKDLSDDLIMLLILSLADRYSAVGEATTEEDIKNHENGVRKILEFIFNSQEPIKPPKIVSGNELIEKFNLKESPLIGKLLYLIEEAWIDGKIKDKEDAFKVVEEELILNAKCKLENAK